MVLPVCESSVCRRSRAVGSVRGEPQVLTREPQTPPRSIQQSFPRCFKSKNKKDKTKKQQWCTEKRAQSQGNLCECSQFLFLLLQKKNHGEKRCWKSWFSGKRDGREEEENLAKRTSWAVFLFVSFMCVSVMCPFAVLSTSAFRACMFCVRL